MEINEKLKDVDHRIKMGNIKWDIESETLESIVITILQLSKTISTHEGNVEMPNISMVWYLYQILNSNNPYIGIKIIFFCLQRQNPEYRRIDSARVDEEIIRLARNLAFPTFQKDSPTPPQDVKVGSI